MVTVCGLEMWETMWETMWEMWILPMWETMMLNVVHKYGLTCCNVVVTCGETWRLHVLKSEAFSVDVWFQSGFLVGG